jgi:hypothetical protein
LKVVEATKTMNVEKADKPIEVLIVEDILLPIKTGLRLRE